MIEGCALCRCLRLLTFADAVGNVSMRGCDGTSCSFGHAVYLVYLVLVTWYTAAARGLHAYSRNWYAWYHVGPRRLPRCFGVVFQDTVFSDFGVLPRATSSYQQISGSALPDYSSSACSCWYRFPKSRFPANGLRSVLFRQLRSRAFLSHTLWQEHWYLSDIEGLGD